MLTQPSGPSHEVHTYSPPVAFDEDAYLAAREAMFHPIPQGDVALEPVAAEPVTAPTMAPVVEPETLYLPVDHVEPDVEAIVEPIAPEPIAAPVAQPDPDATDVWAEAQRLARIAEKQGRPIAPDVALARAKTALGIEEPVAVEPTPEPPSLDEFDAKLADVNARRAKAKADFDPDALDALFDETQQILADRAAAERAHQALNEQRQSAFDAQWDASFAEATTVYPVFAVKGSPEQKALTEMQAKLEKIGDPQAMGADGPKYIAMMTAKALGLVPGLAPIPEPTKPTTTPASSSRPVAASPAIPPKGPAPFTGSGSSPQTSFDSVLSMAAYDDEAYLQSKALMGLR